MEYHILFHVFVIFYPPCHATLFGRSETRPLSFYKHHASCLEHPVTQRRTKPDEKVFIQLLEQMFDQTIPPNMNKFDCHLVVCRTYCAAY